MSSGGNVSEVDLSTFEQETFAKPNSSKSDAQFYPHSRERSGQRVRWHRSLSVGPEILTRSVGSPQRRRQLCASSSSDSMLSESADTALECSVYRGMNVEDAHYLSTKSGMTALWKFLKGKAGEKNWLFWLDAERVKYYKGINQQR